MTRKQTADKLSVYIPRRKLDSNPIERLLKLSRRRDRSLNYLAVEAIFSYLEREENKR